MSHVALAAAYDGTIEWGQLAVGTIRTIGSLVLWLYGRRPRIVFGDLPPVVLLGACRW